MAPKDYFMRYTVAPKVEGCAKGKKPWKTSQGSTALTAVHLMIRNPLALSPCSIGAALAFAGVYLAAELLEGQCKNVLETVAMTTDADEAVGQNGHL